MLNKTFLFAVFLSGCVQLPIVNLQDSPQEFAQAITVDLSGPTKNRDRFVEFIVTVKNEGHQAVCASKNHIEDISFQTKDETFASGLIFGNIEIFVDPVAYRKNQPNESTEKVIIAPMTELKLWAAKRFFADPYMLGSNGKPTPYIYGTKLVSRVLIDLFPCRFKSEQAALRAKKLETVYSNYSMPYLPNSPYFK